METICAISTAHGKGGIAVIRISGEKALEITQKTVRTVKELKNMEGYTITR